MVTTLNKVMVVGKGKGHNGHRDGSYSGLGSFPIANGAIGKVQITGFHQHLGRGVKWDKKSGILSPRFRAGDPSLLPKNDFTS